MDINTALIIILILFLAFLIYLFVKKHDPKELFSDFGNIVPEKDIDTLQQRKFIPAKLGDEIDNQNVMEKAISGMLTTHTPTEPSWSTSNTGTMTGFYLNKPSKTYIQEAYENRAMDADEAIARKQEHHGDMNRKALDGKIRSTKNIYEKYFVPELDQNEKRVWWSSEAEDHETTFDLH
jgi:hypothetical protein